MRILITGGSGFIGSHLTPLLENEGYEVYHLVRNKKKVDDTHLIWDPENDILDVHSIENFQIIIHLAGENISSRRWSKKQKEKILQSRIKSTRLLVEKIKETRIQPQLFISASAVGYYGDRGNEILTEESESGNGFLVDVVRQWENVASSVQEMGIRTVILRSGVVLSRRGGALTKTLLPFKLGLGMILGDGKQYIPWISIDDVIHVIKFIIQNNQITGVANLVAPEPVTNYQYSKVLGKELSRPVIFKAPSIILKLVLGEMAEGLLLSSNRVIPQKLTDHGYKFLHPTIDQAFNAIFAQDI
jgi:uncharacterized protein (TIGR01777 family)